MRLVVVMALFLACTGFLFAQSGADSGLQVREDDGGGVVVRTAGGLLNQNSTLKRRWFAIDDPSSPVRLNRTGVLTRFDEKEQIQLFVPVGTASPKQAVSAVEVRYMLFDVWGQHLRTLALTRLADSSTNVDLRESGWPALDSEASQLISVVAYVARVRTAEGQVWSFDAEKMLAQVQALALTATTVDLTPDERRPIDPHAIYWTYYPTRKSAAASSAGDVHP